MFKTLRAIKKRLNEKERETKPSQDTSLTRDAVEIHANEQECPPRVSEAHASAIPKDVVRANLNDNDEAIPSTSYLVQEKDGSKEENVQVSSSKQPITTSTLLHEKGGWETENVQVSSFNKAIPSTSKFVHETCWSKANNVQVSSFDEAISSASTLVHDKGWSKEENLEVSSFNNASPSTSAIKEESEVDNVQLASFNKVSRDKINVEAEIHHEEKLGVGEVEVSECEAVLVCPSDSQVLLRSMISASFTPGRKFLVVEVEGKQTLFREGNVQLFDRTAIMYYLANPSLKGSNPLEKAQIVQWLSYADFIFPYVACWVHLAVGLTTSQKPTCTLADHVFNILWYLDTILKPVTYLVGERISLADLVVFCSLLPAYVKVLDPELRKPFVNVNRWFVTIMHQPQVARVIWYFKLCDAPPQKRDKLPNKTMNDKPNEDQC